MNFELAELNIPKTLNCLSKRKCNAKEVCILFTTNLTSEVLTNKHRNSRVIDLAAQLEAKSQPDTEAITAMEKAELMEAELEGLHE